jgi:hypothetical protein
VNTTIDDERRRRGGLDLVAQGGRRMTFEEDPSEGDEEVTDEDIREEIRCLHEVLVEERRFGPAGPSTRRRRAMTESPEAWFRGTLRDIETSLPPPRREVQDRIVARTLAHHRALLAAREEARTRGVVWVDEDAPSPANPVRAPQGDDPPSGDAA